MRRALLLLAAAALLAGCHAADDKSESAVSSVSSQTTAAGDDQGLAALYAHFFDLIRTSDGAAACDLVTPRYEERIITDSTGSADDCPQAVLAFADLYADYHPALEQIEIDGNTAKAFDPGDPAHNFSSQKVFFEKADGEWLIAGTD